MARSSEKAMTALSRWRDMKMREIKGIDKRPYIASECNDLPDAQKWRQQIIREIAKKVSQIQNPGMGEFKLRDLNDEINKLLREKRHWEIQIKNLGGPDYWRSGPKILDREGKEVPGNPGYKYFGAARDLPGVRELFEQQAPAPPKKTRAELMKSIDAHYYGYLDEDDGILLPKEEEAEIIAREKIKALWEEQHKTLKENKEEQQKQPEKETKAKSALFGNLKIDDADALISLPQLQAHIPLPSQKHIEMALIRRKKHELMEKYLSSDVMLEMNEAKELLGKDE